MTFSQKEQTFFASKGIEPSVVEEQVENFKKGFPFMELTKPATPGDGIIVFDDHNLRLEAEYFDQKREGIDAIKFVPASGAASRMFKAVYEFIENPRPDSPVIEQLLEWEQFAFGEDVEKHDFNLETIEGLVDLAQFIVRSPGLNYGNLPKGMIKFHKDQLGNRTAFEEHLVEAAKYSSSKGVAKVHFTVSEEHMEVVKKLINQSLPKYEKEFDVKYEINYSVQKPSTDTVAVTLDNKLFKTRDANVLFRPGGHGALIHNLNDIKEELIFIKNIDNVVPDCLKKETVIYKKALAGLLIQTKDTVHSYLRELELGVNEDRLKVILDYAQKRFGVMVTSQKELCDALNKPIRVCGMVKNEGEPGGGPFWVKTKEVGQSVQIVESSQIDADNAVQQIYVSNATHFNPVDLICYTRDYKGDHMNLLDFIDPNTGFISNKSKSGRDLKALELPGLWNGAMANWLSLFVEVPLITFNPVKTLKDLLRKEHLA